MLYGIVIKDILNHIPNSTIKSGTIVGVSKAHYYGSGMYYIHDLTNRNKKLAMLDSSHLMGHVKRIKNSDFKELELLYKPDKVKIPNFKELAGVLDRPITPTKDYLGLFPELAKHIAILKGE